MGRRPLRSCNSCSTSWCWRQGTVTAKSLEQRQKLLETRCLTEAQGSPSLLRSLDANALRPSASVKAARARRVDRQAPRQPLRSDRCGRRVQKMRVNRGQELRDCGLYPRAPKTFDHGVRPVDARPNLRGPNSERRHTHDREALKKRFQGTEVEDAPFVNLPEPKGGRWGQGLTAAKMKECVWLTPVSRRAVEFSNGPARTTCDIRIFVGLREDQEGQGCERE
jgi:hypothetical protein